MVRLEAGSCLSPITFIVYFNSIMVRLEAGASVAEARAKVFQFHYGAIGRSTNCLTCSIVNSFQFHYGAIGRSSTQRPVSRFMTFQFHYGAIGSLPRATDIPRLINFNSIMVRLEVSVLVGYVFGVWDFNSIMVRLEGSFSKLLIRINYISIPLWCDWKTISGCLLLTVALISIPLWCDWKHCLLRCCIFRYNFNSIMVRLEAIAKSSPLELS